MALRKDTNPREMDLQPGLQEILLRNDIHYEDMKSYMIVAPMVKPCLRFIITALVVISPLTNLGISTISFRVKSMMVL